MRPLAFVAALIAAAAAAAEEATAPPDPELLEFLGESAGEDPDMALFMETRAARRALKDAEKEEPKDDDDE